MKEKENFTKNLLKLIGKAHQITLDFYPNTVDESDFDFFIKNFDQLHLLKIRYDLSTDDKKCTLIIESVEQFNKLQKVGDKNG